MFNKILIANRGEIAARIIRACKEMGIKTVAVYSEADALAPYVWLADEAALLGPAPSAESYLRIDKIIDIAQQLACDAIHPGYGFLAENAEFAEAVAAAGITFIGPTAATIRTMGSKTAARSAMEAVGVPVVPGYQEGGSDDELIKAAADVGFPLLVKATAGGGGKGMRIVHDPTELPSAINSAKSEALNSFGDEQIFLERLIEQPHHIEFQIFGDQYGTIVHLYERECSIQRRHQKIVEEAPSPLLEQNTDLRQRMGQAAVAAAQATGYVNAGTVEFLADDAGNFYFLEMNTRLQVEHPVTELVTGVDLVKLQIRIAAGKPLPFTQTDLSQRGHAIECRIYAEDPANGFLPSIGQIHLVQEPVGPGIRVDSGVTSGDKVSIHYDPMLAKLIVLGDNRSDAIAKMLHALREYVILGDLVTNIRYLWDLLDHDAFRAGHTTTDFVEHHLPTWQSAQAEVPDEVLLAAALTELTTCRTQQADIALQTVDDPFSPWKELSGFRIGA
ncbi:MAG: acetyl-CoA carboxylase biotin carboxylase subunit [Chloroflexota bacterium]